MTKSIKILDNDYKQWVKELALRYRNSQIKASVKVNQELLRYYWELGKDISDKQADNKYGGKFYATLSMDLRHEMLDVEGLSETNIRYAKRFYNLYSQLITILPQLVEESRSLNLPQVFKQLNENGNNSNKPLMVEQNSELFELIKERIFSVPWGHHRYIIDKCSNFPQKAFFYLNQVLQNGWSRAMLLNFLDTNMYERQGNAQSNFSKSLPDTMSDLAQEITKDPYNFAFTGLTKPYNERLLKDTMLNNITSFLTELGTGFAYVGKEYRLQIGENENFIDLLFYNLTLSCYVIIEVKIGKFTFGDMGQLGGYVVACNHMLRKEGRDNPSIGLLICKEKDKIQAQYALESSSQPIAISEFELEKFYPEKVEGTIPTIAEIEIMLNENTKESNK